MAKHKKNYPSLFDAIEERPRARSGAMGRFGSALLGGNGGGGTTRLRCTKRRSRAI